MTTLIIASKTFSQAKQRLSGILTPVQRADLAFAMLKDVLDKAMLAAQALNCARVLVVSSDPVTLEWAQQCGADTLVEPEVRGHNKVVEFALQQVMKTGGNVALIPADIPDVSVKDIQALIVPIDSSLEVVRMAPSHDRLGTNAVFMSRPNLITPAFGENSFAGYVQTCRDKKIRLDDLGETTFAHDIDEPSDLYNLIARAPTGATGQFLNSLSLIERYQVPELFHAEASELISRPLTQLMQEASRIRDSAHGKNISFSRKVFIPLTQLCRDVCHYCTFAKSPSKLTAAYLTPEQVLDIARAGKAANCKEALFTLGDKPELRYKVAREELKTLGYTSTLDYLAAMAKLVFDETGLLPHLNPGILGKNDIIKLRDVSVSMGIMLENVSPRLMQRGGCHFGSPDKDPATRLATISAAGELHTPFTSGILIGIGETRSERIDSLLALRELHAKYGHLQEIIIQNFRAKPETLMANACEPDLADLQWTIAVARLIFGGSMNIQAPPNLSQGNAAALIDAGINDFGGVSPVTPDHVNPEAPWPHIDDLAGVTAKAGKTLVERLAIYPEYSHATALNKWVSKKLHKPVLDSIDADGLARTDNWCPGSAGIELPEINNQTLLQRPDIISDRVLDQILTKAASGTNLGETEVTRLFAARDGEVVALLQAANDLRQQVCGDTVSYVVTRNINYTNICYYKCQFCAFSKGKAREHLRGKPYNLGLEEVVNRAVEAWERGAVEVCLQGGIHPDYTGQTYIDLVNAIKRVVPEIHVHAFSPLEIYQGAKTLNLPVREYLQQLIDAGLGSLPGTAAEILDDEVRAQLCPDKINTNAWFDVINTAHKLDLPTTSTIMFGHIDRPVHWSRHLLRLREQQLRTGGFTELVPLPFVHMEAPIYRKGRSRRGPTWRECLLMHAVSRLVLHPVIPNIQASWVKLGEDGISACLDAGANDIGGTLMNETITRSAGAKHGQEMTPERMELVASRMNRTPRQRTTLYGDAPVSRRAPAVSLKKTRLTNTLLCN